MDTIIKGGTIVTANDQFVADLGIKDGKIVTIGTDLGSASEIIDASGKFVMPGMIDAHVHFQFPFGGTVSSDSFETGTRSAAAGGVTTVVDFAIQKSGENLKEVIAARKAEADGNVYVDYSLHGGIGNWNEMTRKQIKSIIEEGISSFKMFMIYREEGMLSTDPMLHEALLETKKYGGMIQIHAESVDLLEKLILEHQDENEMKKEGAWLHVVTRPNVVEAEAIQRALTWAEHTGGHLYIVHMSTGEGADLVKAAQARGVKVIAETCPQYLLLNDEVFKGENGHYYATAPQIKKAKDGARLWQGLKEGHVQVVGTDTCTFDTKQKAMWNGNYTKIPLGLPGTELMLPLLYNDGVRTGKISLNRLIEVASTNPAKVFGMYPQKGSLTIGTDADIVIFDPDKKVTIDYKNLETNCDWSPYQDKHIVGYPHITLVRGTIVGKEGKCVGSKSYGHFIKRGPSRDFLNTNLHKELTVTQ
ncbi:MAG: D-hydantoinase [Candidatus Heimdallarchaeota archaeon LC_3]|nr:MAG: D-hydantoinase [Candidatus Heimdallarchaeota archaeon LC_3]